MLPAFIPVKSTPKRPNETSAVIDLPFGDQSVTMKWPTSDPEGCAPLCPWAHAMIRIDAIWLATEPMDMRVGIETALARVITVIGSAKQHCAYLFANRCATRMRVLLHDAIGVWLAARRLHQGKFHWHGNCSLDTDAMGPPNRSAA
ncbi:IS66 family insertion sequence element accessory protein TnpB [Pseudomonas sp. A1230]|uniref:IS66 family insertion sequence element accessory protein TnpB n=1 Tax=Pseudomonas sp. A1230 TaxID=3235106 RepID=UPI003784FF56